MKRFLLLILAVAGLFCLVPSKADAGVAVAVAPAYYGGYGPAYYPYPYWYGGGWHYFGDPGFLHGRYNGGSYGPCWTSTPIGLMWNCG